MFYGTGRDACSEFIHFSKFREIDFREKFNEIDFTKFFTDIQKLTDCLTSNILRIKA